MLMTQTERKPLMKPKPNGKFFMHDFQEQDISALLEMGNSSNWSEMLSGQ